MEGKRVINGTYTTLWWDNMEIAELKSVSAKIMIEREDVDMAGTLDVDSKIKRLKGEGTLKVHKVRSLGLAEMFNALKAGKDPESMIVIKSKDPDALGQERLFINGVKIDELTLMSWENGTMGESEFPFRFKPSNSWFSELIITNN